MFKNINCSGSNIYIDDIIVIGEIYEACLVGTIKTINFFLKLGFIIHPEKSSLPRISFQFKGNVAYA